MLSPRLPPFSGNHSEYTDTTTGYGDLLLPGAWRLVGTGEASTGILMCGWSIGFFFAVANRVVEQKSHKYANGFVTPFI